MGSSLSIYVRFIFATSECEDAEPEAEKLVQSQLNGEITLLGYIENLPIDAYDICHIISTLLFDCSRDPYRNHLLKILEDNLPSEYYIQILENMYLGHHDT